MTEDILEADVVRVNRALLDTLVGTYNTACHWDSWAKHLAFNSVAWDVLKKFSDLAPTISDPVLSEAVEKFVKTCRSAKEENPKIDEMRSDIALNAFETMAQEVVDSEAAKSHNWDDENSLFKMSSVSNMREIMAKLAEEAEPFESHQMAMPGLTVIEIPPWYKQVWSKIRSFFG